MAKTLKPPKTLGNFPKWKKADGPVKWVFANKPAGHRCAWTCIWRCADGQIQPRDWAIELLTWKQLFYELEDLANMPKHPRRNDAREMLALVSATSGGQFVPEVKRLLRESRELYPDYLAPWHMPDSELIFKKNHRPGWE